MFERGIGLRGRNAPERNLHISTYDELSKRKCWRKALKNLTLLPGNPKYYVTCKINHLNCRNNMTTEKDYYELLEVSRDCNGDELKKSYRRLAMKFHPDRNPGNAEAEMHFKEINEAYEVLKDDQKRAAYDRYGHQAFQNGGMGGGNPFGGFEFNFGSGGFSDIFADVFSEFMGGGRRGNRQSYAQHGADLRYNLEITLEEAFFGVEKEIKIPSTTVCEACHGHGTADGKEPEICPDCKGSGRIHQQQGGFFIVETTCPKCQGKGRIIKDSCKKCKGAGVIGEEKVIKVKIPAGIEDDTRMRISGGGEAGLHGGQNGDLYVFINIKPHKLYSREGANLYAQVPISMTCAALGGKIEMPAVDGEKIELEIPAGSQTDQQQKIRGQGMTMMRSKGRGDLFVRLRVETPVNLSARQKELLEEFRSISGDDNCQPEAKGFFEKIKDLFKSVA